MTDLALAWDATSYTGDLALAGVDLAADDGLRTAVLLSLFTDRRAEVGDPRAGETARRGWWGDTLTDGDRIGSRLWLLGREKRVADVVRRAEEYARESVAWLVEDGAAERVEVTAEDDEGVLLVTVTVYRDGADPERISAPLDPS